MYVIKMRYYSKIHRSFFFKKIKAVASRNKLHKEYTENENQTKKNENKNRSTMVQL